VPAGRPYNLGEPVTPGFTEVTASGRKSRPSVVETGRPAVSGRASLRYDGQAGVISGRGLY
jgi:hypothetical protein